MPVGPRDLLKAMGYSESGYLLPLKYWKPGLKEGNHPCWLEEGDEKVPKCAHRIPYVTATGNSVRREERDASSELTCV